MAGVRGTSDLTRENVLIDGFLKHREAGIVTRWRHRYVVFKIASAGRLTFTIYKDKPATPTNELHEIPIEEYGGLDSTLKTDGEKHVFAILTMQSTECFAAESAESLRDWSRTIQEYLGKELVLNISIPYKQNILKPGRAQIRIRNTGFTITTADIPPRCQGSWQILHIRKFGGSEHFRFETGTKCPYGPHMYVIDTNDNEKLKSVFTDLSMHKPIFCDDRMGRRMTQEHAILRNVREQMMDGAAYTHQRIGSRRSLQTAEGTYENQMQFTRRKSHQEPSRSRSNAILMQDTPELSAFAPPIHSGGVYYNVHEVGGMQYSIPAPPPIRRASSDPPEEKLYYNQMMVPSPQHQAKPKTRRRRGSSDSEADSDDDFVDVQEIMDTPNSAGIYYNVQTSVRSRNSRQEEPSSAPALKPSETANANYENVTPTQSLINRAHASTNDEGTVPVYTNLSIPSKEKQKQSFKNVSSSNDHASHSDSELEPISRHRSTSIVNEQVVVSADHTPSVSCENISRFTTSAHSSNDHGEPDAELAHLKTVLDNRVKRSPSPLLFSRNSEKHRPSAYDHLEPVMRVPSDPKNTLEAPPTQDTPTGGDMDENKRSPPNTEKKSSWPDRAAWLARRVHTYEDIDLPEESFPGSPRSSSTSPESQSSSEEPSNNPTQPYDRKISVLGHRHTYEYIEVQKLQEGGARQSEGAGTKGVTSPTRSISPNLNTAALSRSRPPLPWQDGSTEDEPPSPSSPAVATGNGDSPRHRAKKPIPTPRYKMNKMNSVDDIIMTKRGKDHRSDEPVTQSLGVSHHYTHTSPSHQRSPRNHPPTENRKPSVTSPSHAPALPPKMNRAGTDPNTRPSPAHTTSTYKSSLLQGHHPRTSLPDRGVSTAQRLERFPRVPPKNQPMVVPVSSTQQQSATLNYTAVYVSTSNHRPASKQHHHAMSFSTAANGSGSAVHQAKRAAAQDISVNYTDINHFFTQQIQNMREERDLEKAELTAALRVSNGGPSHLV